MKKTHLIFMLATSALLAGCAGSGGAVAPSQPEWLKTSLPPNCQVGSLSACRVVISGGTGSSPTFVATPNDAIAPSNAGSNVDLYWVLPAGYMFYPGDGVVLANALPFSSPFVTNAAGAPSSQPDVGFHWTMNQGLSQVQTKYTIVFHQAGLSGKGQGWSCDPTIANFGAGIAKASPMLCTPVP